MALHFLKSLLNSNDNKKSYDISLAPVSSSFNTTFDSITCNLENNRENKKTRLLVTFDFFTASSCQGDAGLNTA